MTYSSKNERRKKKSNQPSTNISLPITESSGSIIAHYPLNIGEQSLIRGFAPQRQRTEKTARTQRMDRVIIDTE